MTTGTSTVHFPDDIIAIGEGPQAVVHSNHWFVLTWNSNASSRVILISMMLRESSPVIFLLISSNAH